MWSEISPAKKVKLLFLLDHGDITTGKTEVCRRENRKAVEEARCAFRTFLQDPNDSSCIEEVLKKRAKELFDYTFTPLPSDHVPYTFELPDKFVATQKTVRKDDEDLLTFLGACHLLGIECEKFDAKKQQVQQKLDLNEKERGGNFYIYAENLRMTRISDQLSAGLVHKFFEIVKEEKKWVDSNLDVPLPRLENVEGLKDALFFYIVRMLETNGKLNRIYTNVLEELLDILSKRVNNEVEEQTITNVINELSTYPNECRPTGHCIAFCVTEEREGAQGEIKKVKEVFEKSLGYTVSVKENPTMKVIEECRKELAKEKYRCYDSLVVWFMSHGNGTKIQLCDGPFERKDIIDSFCKLDNFKRKPKIFFMASCQGGKGIPIKDEGGIPVAIDGALSGETEPEPGFITYPERVLNITAVYYEMDRIIASATLPDKFAFRIPAEGSVYVDTVCHLMEKHRGDNITQVLEKAGNKMHQILFSSIKNEFNGEAKQACYYESTFQKTFIVPNGNVKI